MNEMTEELLRQALKEAQKKGQIGLLIWSNWSIWDDVAYQLKEGNENYDFALAQVEKEEEATMIYEWAGFKMAGYLAVSVKKLGNSEEFFKEIFGICEKEHYTGPITLIPLNELADCC